MRRVRELFWKDPVLFLCLIGGILLLLPWHKLWNKPPDDSDPP